MKLVFCIFASFIFQIHGSNPTVLEQIIPKNEAYEKYGQALGAIFGMGIRLQAFWDKPTDENFVVSPLSTTVIIGQLMMGAEGELLDQLYFLLSLPRTSYSYSLNRYIKNRPNESRSLPYAGFHLQLSSLIKNLQKRKTGEQFILNLDNALFYNKNLELNEFFKTWLANIYDTDITPLDFYKDTASIINKWASTHTNGLIKNVVSNNPSPSTGSVFLNSVYFKAEWETPFSEFLNTNDIFFTKNDTNTVNATYMMGILKDIPYIQTKQYRIVCLPYKNRELGMYIIYPNQDNEFKYNIKKFMETLNPQELLTSVESMKERDVVVKIPKLSLSNTLRILKTLQKYREFKKEVNIESRGSPIDEIVTRVNTYKNYTAPVLRDMLLTAAAENVDLKVSDIVQQMVFSINEKGTEAAAVTSGIFDLMGGSKTVVLNRPFSFFIRHEATLATLFWGTISDPTKN